MDDYTLAKRLFNGKGGSNSSGSALSGAVTTFQALALSDSVNGMVTIDMGGAVTSGNGQQGVEVATTVVVKKGQTVIVQNSGGSLVVIGVIGGEDGLKEDLETDLLDKIQQAGEKLEESVLEQLKPLEESFEDFKQNHQFTDEDITIEINKTKTELSTQISGVIETADAAFESATTAQQTVDSFKTEVNQKFEDYDEGVVELQSSIEQTASDIRAEVSKELYNEDGTAKYTTKSDLEIAENEISASVEGTVMGKVDDSISSALDNALLDENGKAIYTSKTDLAMNNEELSLTIKQTYIDPVSNTANSAKTTANNANNTANDALEKVEEVETYFDFTTYGLKVGKTGQMGAVRVASDGSFEVLYNSQKMLDVYYDSSYSATTMEMPMTGKLRIESSSSSIATFSSSGYSFSSSQIGFSVNGLRAVEAYHMSWPYPTYTNSHSITGTGVASTVEYIVVYYRSYFGGTTNYHSVKVPFSEGDTVKAHLMGAFYDPTGMIIVSEDIELSITSGSKLKITRNSPVRVAVKNGTCTSNTNPGVCFYVDDVTFCC